MFEMSKRHQNDIKVSALLFSDTAQCNPGAARQTILLYYDHYLIFKDGSQIDAQLISLSSCMMDTASKVIFMIAMRFFVYGILYLVL